MEQQQIQKWCRFCYLITSNMPKPFFLSGKVCFFFFFSCSGFNCSSTGTSNQSQFLKSHRDKQPRFITHQCRNLELNLHSCTNPTLLFQMVPAWRNNNCRSFVWPRVYICVSVCAHACVVPHQRPHPFTATWPPGRPPFPRYRPAILIPSPSVLILCSHQRRGGWRSWRLLRWTGCVEFVSLHFFSRLHPAAQTASYIYTR